MKRLSIDPQTKSPQWISRLSDRDYKYTTQKFPALMYFVMIKNCVNLIFEIKQGRTFLVFNILIRSARFKFFQIFKQSYSLPFFPLRLIVLTRVHV